MENAILIKSVVIEDASAGCAGELNDSAYCFRVNQLQPALDAIKETLTAVTMLNNATIHYYQPGRNIVYCDRVGDADKSGPNWNDEQFCAKLADIAKRIIAQMPPTPPEPPSPGEPMA